ncbi:hypothetical protein ACX80W_15035 [Arthrobacter sp. TMN-37]
MHEETGGVSADSAQGAREHPAGDPGEASGTRTGAAAPPEVPPTGDAGVDAVLGRLADLDGQPVGAHAGFYTSVHDALLTELNPEG